MGYGASFMSKGPWDRIIVPSNINREYIIIIIIIE